MAANNNTTVAITISANTEPAETSVKSFKTQLREANGELVAMSEKFGAASTEAVAAAKKVAGLKDAIGDAKALAETFNPDKKFVALGGAIQGAVSGFSALQGASALFGGESKELEKTLLKVQSAMALQQGISGIFNSIDSFKLLANTIKTNVVTSLTTLRGALIATGLGALSVGLGLLIANFDKVKQVVLNLIPGLASVGKFVGGLVDRITDFIGVTSDASRELAKMRQEADKSLTLNNKYLAQHGDQLDKYTKAKIEAKNRYLEAVKDETNSEKDRIEFAKKLNRELAAADKERSDDAAKAKAEAAKKAADKQKEIDDKKAAAEQKRLAEEEKFQQLRAEFLGKAELAIQKSEFDRARVQVLINDEAKRREINQIKDAKKRSELIILLEQETANELLKIATDEAEKNKEIQAKRLADLNKKVEDNLALDKKRIDATRKEQEDQQALAIELVEKGKTKDQQELDNLEALYEKKREIAKGNATLLLMVEEDYQKAKAQLQFLQQERELSMYSEVAGRFADIVGRQTAAGKALAIAQATIDTFGAANKVLNSNSPTFIINPYLRFASAAATVITGIMNIKKIASTQVPGGGGGGGGGSVPNAPQAPMLPQASSTTINQGQINQIGNVAARAFVVESDVSGNQERIQRLNRAARIS
jgi:hypothetical protein